MSSPEALRGLKVVASVGMVIGKSWPATTSPSDSTAAGEEAPT